MFSKSHNHSKNHEFLGILLDMMDEGDNGGNETGNDSSGKSQRVL